MNLATATLIRPRAGGPRNGLTVRFYRYRGADGPDLLTPDIDAMPDHLFGRGRSEGTVLAPCGTEAAYRRHRRHGEPVDDDCRRAGTEAAAERARNRWRP